MKVNLSMAWFGPDATLYSTRDNPHQFPQGWKDRLPENSEVLGDEDAPEGEVSIADALAGEKTDAPAGGDPVKPTGTDTQLAPMADPNKAGTLK